MSLRIHMRNAVHRSSKNIRGPKGFLLILGRDGDLMILFNVYNLQNISTYGTFLCLLKIRVMFNCRNRTVGFYEEKT